MPLLLPTLSGTPGAAVAAADPVLEPTTLTPPIPTGYALDDTLICYTASTLPTPTVATPTGWTRVLDVTGTYGHMVLFAKAVVTTELPPDIVWSNLTAGGPCQARIAAFKNLDNDNLASIVDVVGTVSNNTSSSGSSTAGATVTTVGDHDLVLALTTRQASAGTFTAPNTFALVSAGFGTTSGTDMAMAWAWQRKAVPGAIVTPNFGLTGAGAAGSSGVVVAFKAQPASWTTYKELILATSGIISYWRLGETVGNALDSKSTNHGTVVGAVTRAVAGLIRGDVDAAVHGDGAAGTYISAPYASELNPSLISFECWIVLDAVVTSRVIVRRASHYLSVSSQSAYAFTIQEPGGTVISVVTPNNSIKTGVRQHLVGVYGGGTVGMKLYVNGVDSGGAPTFTPPAFLSQSDVTSPLIMLASGVAVVGMPGTLDEVVVYNRQLTPTEILEHFTAGNGTADKPTGSITFTGSCVETSTAPPSYYDAPNATLSLSGSTAEAGVQPFSWGGAARELPPLRHHLDAIAPNGRHYRWGGDEPDAQNVPSGLRWGSTMPGGYESCDCVLPRRPGVDYADLERLTTLRVISNGGQVVGEYRLERTPQTSGDQMAISPSAVGWQAHLDDHKGVSVVFIDRELGSWVSASSQRQLALLQGLIDPIDAQSTSGEDGMPSLKLAQQGAWTRRWNCESYYFFPPGDAAGRVKFDYTAAASVVLSDANWVAEAWASVADGYSGFTQLSPADWLTAVSGSVDISAATVADANRRALMLRLFYGTGPAGSDNTAYDVFLRYMRVIGNHTLPLRGLTPASEGYNASDMIGYALRKWCPLIRVATPPRIAPAGEPQQPADTQWIQQTDFIIPQAKFVDTTTGEIVKQLTRFGLEDWGVWNDKTFYLSRRNGSPLTRKWRARIGPARLEETGKQADRLWESIVVQFNDVDGSSKTVGPPGSGANVESVYLKDNDPDNPANKLGITRRDKLIMGVSTANGAIEVGRRFLEEQKLIDRSGRATLVGHVMDDHGVLWPYSAVQAGDLITFVDAADTSYRRIVKADHDERGRSVSVDLDAPPEGLQAVLERLAVVLAPFGL
jgi:hypothetical protein